MTIQIIENWSDILGVVEAVESSEDLEDFDLLVDGLDRVFQAFAFPGEDQINRLWNPVETHE